MCGSAIYVYIACVCAVCRTIYYYDDDYYFKRKRPCVHISHMKCIKNCIFDVYSTAERYTIT